MSKKTFIIGDWDFYVISFNDEPYISTWELTRVFGIQEGSAGFFRFLRILNARPECKFVTAPGGKEPYAIHLRDVCNVLTDENFFVDESLKTRIENFVADFKEKVLPKYFPQDKKPQDKTAETERIKKFVADYAEMFGMTKLEAFREIVQRKFNPPADMHNWIQLTIDKEWLA